MNNKFNYIANKITPKIVPPDIYTFEQLTSMDQYYAAKNIEKVNRSLKFYSDNNLFTNYIYKLK